MKFAIRWTERIEEDLKRGFSGWQGGVWEKLSDALTLHGIYEEDLEEDFADLEELDDLEIQGCHFKKYDNLWFSFHHNGLSCFELDLEGDEDEAEVISIAQQCYQDDRFTPVGDGDRTIGRVEVVSCLQQPTEEEMGCYLIKSEDIAPN